MTPTVLASLTVPWIGLPHRMDVVHTRRLPEGYGVTTAFVLAVDADDRTLLTRVDRPDRGWEVPGGHLDPGESPVDAAVRELAEETGLVARPSDLGLIGGQQITVLEQPPADYAYPRLAFMAFYTLRLPSRGPTTAPAPGSECTEAAWVDRAGLRRRCPTAAWHPLHATLFSPPAP
jgi:8-oxo-dGTP pyrophosphatase MutT (NUDIX family)